MEKIIVDSHIEEVTFYTNGAVITRKAVIGGLRQARVILDNVEDSIDPKSIKVYLSDGYVRNISYEKYKKKPEKEENEEIELARRLKELSKKQGDIISAISHEFKNPVAAILGYAQP